MYKSGRLWVFAAISLMTIGVSSSFGTTSYADSTGDAQVQSYPDEHKNSVSADADSIGNHNAPRKQMSVNLTKYQDTSQTSAAVKPTGDQNVPQISATAKPTENQNTSQTSAAVKPTENQDTSQTSAIAKPTNDKYNTVVNDIARRTSELVKFKTNKDNTAVTPDRPVNNLGVTINKPEISSQQLPNRSYGHANYDALRISPNKRGQKIAINDYINVSVSNLLPSQEDEPYKSGDTVPYNISIENNYTKGEVIPAGTKITIAVIPENDKIKTLMKFIRLSVNSDFVAEENNDGTTTVTVKNDLYPGHYSFSAFFSTKDPGYNWDGSNPDGTKDPTIVRGETVFSYESIDGEIVPIANDAVFVEPKQKESSGYIDASAIGWSAPGNSAGIPGSKNYPTQVYPTRIGGIWMNDPAVLSASGKNFFTYQGVWQTWNPVANGTQSGRVVFTSDIPFDKNATELYTGRGDRPDPSTVVDISKDPGVSFTFSDDGKTLIIDFSDYLKEHRSNLSGRAFFSQAFVVADNLDLVNKARISLQYKKNNQTGWSTGGAWNYTSSFFAEDVNSTTPYFKGNDHTLYDNQTYLPKQDVYAFSGQKDITSSIEVTDLDGYPSDGVNPKPGKYTIKYSITNGDGEPSVYSRVIDVLPNQTKLVTKDNTIVAGPTALWDPTMNLESLVDQDGETVSVDNIKVTGSVNTSTPGEYLITYSYTDSTGKLITSSPLVTVVSSKANIDLKDTTISVGDRWSKNDNLVHATDAYGSMIGVDKLNVVGSVDTTKVGKYTVTYSYTDISGNVVSKEAIITVTPPSTPGQNNDLKLLAHDSSIKLGSKWNAKDNFDGGTNTLGQNITIDQVKVSGQVDVSKAGSYRITYTYNDPSGSVASKTITVKVVSDELNSHEGIKTGSVIYGLKHFYLYNDATFSKKERLVSYAWKSRLDRPMFIVTKIIKNENGRIRYQVRDVNHDSKTYGRTGYITARKEFVAPVYYQSNINMITVINTKGINSYGKKNLTKKVKHYKQGQVLKIAGIVKHNLTTRFVLTDGSFITANKKLVKLGKQPFAASIRTKYKVYVYKDVNLSKSGERRRAIKKGTKITVKALAYSNNGDLSRQGIKRYQVTGGFISGNRTFVRVLNLK